MSKADEMFNELGYRKNEDKRVIIYDYIQYFNHFKVYKKIYFFKIEKNITLKSYNLTDELSIDFNMTMQELQAINAKVKELRMGGRIMREIKFRIWADNKWYDRCLVGSPSINNKDDDWVCPLVWLEDKKEWVHCDNGIICEYTGLKDKNGKEIYERRYS